MNILHVSAQKPDSTGSGIYLAQLVSGFARAGHKQAVIAGIAPGDKPRFPEGVSFYPVRFETSELPFPVAGMSNVMPYTATRYCDMSPEMAEQFKTAFVRATNQVLDAFVPDVVVCHHLYLATAVVAHTVRARAGADAEKASCKVVAISHSTDINQMNMHDLQRDYIVEGMHMLDAALALHAPQAAEIVHVYGLDPARIQVIGTGYDSTQFHRLANMRQEGARDLLYVGKIWRRKGVESLIRAIDSLPTEQAPTKTTLVGGYSNEDEYQVIVDVASVCRHSIEFAGVVSQQGLIDAYNQANVFVLPSFYEGLPLVILEALGCGCNVVATDLPGIQEWITGQLADAPIRFVRPPRMQDSDTPVEADLPAFEERLASALVEALDASTPTCDTTPLSWDAVCQRLLAAFEAS